jgi:SET domain-containing protein
MKLLPSSKIYIDVSKIQKAGRGVFAKVDIKKGELIEMCPVIDLSEHDTDAIREGTLISYLYYFGKEKKRSVVTLGFGSIYNHTYSPNALYKENHQQHLITFTALQDIKQNEEITVNYNGQKKTNKKTLLWFDA